MPSYSLGISLLRGASSSVVYHQHSKGCSPSGGHHRAGPASRRGGRRGRSRPPPESARCCPCVRRSRASRPNGGSAPPAQFRRAYRRAAIPHGQQYMAVGAQVDAESRVMRVAPWPVLGGWTPGCRPGRGAAPRPRRRRKARETVPPTRRPEVLLVQRRREGQGDDQRDAEGARLFGDHAIRSLGQRAHDDQRQVGMLRPQFLQELARAAPQLRDLFRHEVPMAGDADHQRHQVARQPRSGRVAQRVRGISGVHAHP
jgi:hypothetical protein